LVRGNPPKLGDRLGNTQKAKRCSKEPDQNLDNRNGRKGSRSGSKKNGKLQAIKQMGCRCKSGGKLQTRGGGGVSLNAQNSTIEKISGKVSDVGKAGETDVVTSGPT